MYRNAKYSNSYGYIVTYYTQYKCSLLSGIEFYLLVDTNFLCYRKLNFLPLFLQLLPDIYFSILCFIISPEMKAQVNFPDIMWYFVCLSVTRSSVWSANVLHSEPLGHQLVSTNTDAKIIG